MEPRIVRPIIVLGVYGLGHILGDVLETTSGYLLFTSPQITPSMTFRPLEDGLKGRKG